MHPTHAILYDRLVRFPIDDGEPALRFEARLAQEQRWPLPCARRVIREYRRFLFLAATADDPVTPSKPVDAAWHLHLTYTRSYWDRLCGEVLGKPLHHDPTRGGPDEGAKFDRQYDWTLAAYRNAFGQEPPADLWPSARSRGRFPQAAAALVAVGACVGCGLGTELEFVWATGFVGLLALAAVAWAIVAGCRALGSARKGSDGCGGGWSWGGGGSSDGTGDGACGDGGGAGGCGGGGCGGGGCGGGCGGC